MNYGINLVFFTSTAGHFGHKDVYKITILHYKKLFNGWGFFSKVFCHIKVRPKEQDQLPEMIDFLYENDIHPLVTIGDWQRGMSHQNEYLKDIYTVFSNPEIQANPYTFWVEDDSPLKINGQTTAVDFVLRAIEILRSNPTILNFRFMRDGLPVNPNDQIDGVFNKSNVFDFQPNISRSRDLYIASLLIMKNWENFKNIQCEMGFRMAMDTISSMHPYRYLVFNPALITSYHIGTPDYQNYLTLPDFNFTQP